MLNGELLFEKRVVLDLMRDRFLSELVSGGGKTRSNVKEQMTMLELNPYFVFPAIALAEPVVRFQDEREKLVYVETVRDYLRQHAGTGTVVFMDKEQRLGLLFSWKSKDLLESVRKMLSTHFGQSIAIAVGKPCNHLKDVFQSYNQAAEALRDKFYYGAEEIIYFNAPCRYETVQQYPMDKEKELCTDFMAAENSDDIKAAVKRFYDGILENGRVEPASLYDLTVRLLVGIEKRAVAESGTFGTYEKFQIMSVIRLGTLQEIQDYVSTFLTGLKGAVAPGQRESHCSIIKKTIKYMEQECSQASLQNVAQQVYMTPTYLSLLFKLNTGKTFIEHLTDIRIEKAKDMLKSTHFKNYEVAEKVGYQDSRYFSQIFKKKVGLSPSEYRESVGN